MNVSDMTSSDVPNDVEMQTESNDIAVQNQSLSKTGTSSSTINAENETKNELEVNKDKSYGNKEASDEDDDLGTTVLPIAKVKRILKIDPGYLPTTESTVFVIAKSTEYFIKHLAMKAHMNTKIEKRSKLQYKDFSNAVQSHDDLQFLKRMVPPTVSARKLMANDQIKYNKSRLLLKQNAERGVKKSKKDIEGIAQKETFAVEKNAFTLDKGQQVLSFKKANSDMVDEGDATVTNTEEAADKMTADVNKSSGDGTRSNKKNIAVNLDELVDSEPEYSENEDNDEVPIQMDDEDEDAETQESSQTQIVQQQKQSSQEAETEQEPDTDTAVNDSTLNNSIIGDASKHD